MTFLVLPCPAVTQALAPEGFVIAGIQQTETPKEGAPPGSPAPAGTAAPDASLNPHKSDGAPTGEGSSSHSSAGASNAALVVSDAHHHRHAHGEMHDHISPYLPTSPTSPSFHDLLSPSQPPVLPPGAMHDHTGVKGNAYNFASTPQHAASFDLLGGQVRHLPKSPHISPHLPPSVAFSHPQSPHISHLPPIKTSGGQLSNLDCFRTAGGAPLGCVEGAHNWYARHHMSI